MDKVLVGRRAGVHLNEAGRQQARHLADALADIGINRIFSSPLERAHETAEPLSKKLGLDVTICEAFTEIDFGDWTGLSFAELKEQKQWQLWNTHRAGTRAPNGELAIETQQRFVSELERLRHQFPNEHIAVFSHADPLKTVLMYYLGMSLDRFPRLELKPASCTVLALEDWGPQLRGLNLQFDQQFSAAIQT